MFPWRPVGLGASVTGFPALSDFPGDYSELVLPPNLAAGGLACYAGPRLARGLAAEQARQKIVEELALEEGAPAAHPD